MDFFAGSGTTGHAVIQLLNRDEGGYRRFILVQLPEPVAGNEQFSTIFEVTKARAKAAGERIKAENPDHKGDTGFRVFKLDSSNIRAWEPDREDLDGTLLGSIDHIKSDRSEEDILYELLLKLGLDLCVPIETKTIAGKCVHSVGAGTLIACLVEAVSRDDVEPLAAGIADWHDALAPAGETTVIFRDSAFADDVAKANLAETLKQRGLGNVRCDTGGLGMIVHEPA